MTDQSQSARRPEVVNTVTGTVSGDVVQADSVAIYSVDADQFVAGRDVHLHFRDGLRGVRGVVSGPVADQCPYPGLAEFGPHQAQWFFGRGHLVTTVLERLDRRTSAGGPLLVVAPSGAGKSSLLRAGVLPALARGALPGSRAWPSLLTTPTEQPVLVLARYLATLVGMDARRTAELVVRGPAVVVDRVRAALRASGPQVRLVVIVDQLEELFTVCAHDWQRVAVLDLLDRLARHGPAGEPPVALVLFGLRADFYPRCADYPPLRAAALDSQVLVGPMTETELREAVLFPAHREGLTVEPGLVELLLRDLGALRDGADTPTGQAGRLPLLAHALRVTWQQRHGSTLTVQGYQSTGGIARAVATTAEDIFRRLSPQDQSLAQSVFLRLVAIAEGSENTRRRVPRSHLLGITPANARPLSAPSGQWVSFAQAAPFGSAIPAPGAAPGHPHPPSGSPGTTAGHPVDAFPARTAEPGPPVRKPARTAAVIDAFTHARLLTQTTDTVEITHESLLHSWPRLHDWITHNRATILLRQHLDDAARYWESSGHDPTTLYRGGQLATAQEWAEHRTDLTALEHRFLRASTDSAHATLAAARRTNRRLSRRLTAVVLMLVLALAAGTAAVIERANAEHERNLAISRQLAANSRLAMAKNPREAMSYALDAWRTAPTSEARGALLSTQSLDYEGRLLTGMESPALAVSPDGSMAAFGGPDGQIQLWNTRTRQRFPASFPSQVGVVHSLAFSPDGTMLAAASYLVPGESNGPHLLVWQVPTGVLVSTVPGVFTVKWRPDGQALLSLDESNFQDVVELDVRSGRVLRRIVIPAEESVPALAYSPDGDLIATGTSAGVVEVYRADTGTRLHRLTTDGPTGTVMAIAISARGVLAASSPASHIRLWDARTGARMGDLGAGDVGGRTIGLAFLPGVDLLATSSIRGEIVLWDTRSSRVHSTIAVGSEMVWDLVMSQDGSTILTTAASGEATVLGRGARSHDGSWARNEVWAVTGLAVSPGGDTVASADADGTLRHWDIDDRSAMPLLRLLSVVPESADPPGAKVVFGPDGTEVLASAGVRVWWPGRALSGTIAAPGRVFLDVRVSPDGRLIAAVSVDLTGQTGRRVHVWDSRSLVPVAEWSPAPHEMMGTVLFTPDGARLLVEFSSTVDAVTRHGIRAWTVDPVAVQADLINTDIGIGGMKISPDGRTVATGHDDGRVRLWDVDTGAKKGEFGEHTSLIRTLAFVDDQTLVTGTINDPVIRQWNYTTGELVAQIEGHRGPLNVVAVAKGGKVLASASADSTVGVWDLDPEVVAARVCRILADDGRGCS
ncbi:NACHT and WD repeat domain-containing protein [Actinokineospora terrae]|uniref:WD40 repeat n=1 Tax=Actinokineospora terrae TaxID=155974 RepID=A0A1H9KYF8_9PSEU|nr:AAA family ATPase [Actinokineospora terrae]SER03945.1 WD40 repeat [Actinokineospora terrae]